MFTVPVTGVWRVSYTLRSYVDTGKYIHVYLYHNWKVITETQYHAFSDEEVRSTGGRELFTRASKGDTFHLHAYYMNSKVLEVITCFELVSL